MPLLVEDDARNAVGFDVTTASTLFWKPVPVLLRQQEREDQQEDLTFRILSGVARQNHNLRVGYDGCVCCTGLPNQTRE